jgi:hypothetical protein
MEEHVKRGKEKIEIDGTMEVVKTLPAQSKIILYSVLLLSRCKKDGSSTGNVYSMSKNSVTLWVWTISLIGELPI